MIVVDTNILISLYVEDSNSEAVHGLRERVPKWCAPELWRSEMRNALTMMVRQRHIQLDFAVAVIRNAEALMRTGEHRPDSASVLELAANSECSAYDCEFVAVAISRALPLYTLDKRILRAFPDVARPPEAGE